MGVETLFGTGIPQGLSHLNQLSLAGEGDLSPRKKQAQVAYFRAHKPSFVDSLGKTLKEEGEASSHARRRPLSFDLRPSAIEGLRAPIGIEGNFSKFSLDDGSLGLGQSGPSSSSWFSSLWGPPKAASPAFTTPQNRGHH